MSYGIHWFRRDLRVAGNPGLRKQFEAFDGRVLGLFCFDHKFLSRSDFSVNRFQFFLHTLRSLQEELKAAGGDLLVLDTGPEESFKKIFAILESNKLEKPQLITWCRDYENFARARDEKMAKLFSKLGVECATARDHLLLEPGEVDREPGQAYKVYSPFARRWLEAFRTKDIQERVAQQKPGLQYVGRLQKNQIQKSFKFTWKDLLGSKATLKNKLSDYIESNAKKVNIQIPEAGTRAAWKCLGEFESKIDNYKDQRDFPYQPATSRVSMFLKNGSITIPQIIAHFDLKPYKKKKDGRSTYFSELIWREFYYHILWYFPHVETSSFNPAYDKVKWGNNNKWFEAWKEGRTGYPIVDAGIRELNTTGFMHNRVRMIVASFLTKDLLIDWRWGEKYFMEKLLDGDLAPNNGGWQWAASTGCDAQPYFRIFNPWLQSKKFDEDAIYIKKFIPELEDLDPKEIHQPILGHKEYPEPIVDHSTQREKAIKMFEKAKS